MMLSRIALFAPVFVFLAGCQSASESPTNTFLLNSRPSQSIEVKYPPTYRDTSVFDDFHGTEVSDPYRWLEDPDDSSTVAWVEAQNEVTFGYLDQIPFRDEIRSRLEALWNYERYSPPSRHGGKYYFFKNDGLQNQSVLYVKDEPDEEARVVLDPNTFSEDGTVALGGISFSADGHFLAYQVSEGGSDWHTARILDLETGAHLDDELECLKFSSLAWAGNGFYYSRYPEPASGERLSGKNEFHALYYHELGKAQESDIKVFSDNENARRGFFGSTSEDEQFLVVSVWETTSGNALYVKGLKNPDAPFMTISEDMSADWSLVGNDGNRLYFLTNDGAPNQRLVALDAEQYSPGQWEEVIGEKEDVLEGVELIGGKLVAQYLHNATSKIEVFDLEGTSLGEVSLPGLGVVSGLTGKADDPQAFFSFNGFTRPSSIYTLDVDNLEVDLYQAPTLDFDSDAFETYQVWYQNPKDSTRIPMFITHKKGLKRDGKRPVLLYGYGGFNISVKPGFNVTRAVLLENDGVYAVPNIRGGGEFGQDWHKAGTLERKQNVFDDFIAAAEYLIDEGYTNPANLAIQGGSNGGLLVGACMTQRPDLFGVCFPMVGVLDMLRYHLFTIGSAWAVDYGLSSDPEAFEYLYAYSPLHNAKSADYPATMIITGDHDDRVVPAHSYKFASALQSNQQGDKPVLLRVETSAGHGAGKPVSKQVDESADWLSFLFFQMGSADKE